jgi:magnesium transporter
MTRRAHRSRHRRRTPAGAPPGTLTVDPQSLPSAVSVIAYGKDASDEFSGLLPADIVALRKDHETIWVNVDGLGDVEFIRDLGEALELHPLALEDVINIHQRPKVEEYDHHLFIVTRMPSAAGNAETEQISIFLGAGYVITFQERPGDVFEPVRARIRNPQARIRSASADYLAYALVDAVIDNYFPVLERRGEELEELEDRVMKTGDAGLIGQIHEMKRDLLDLRRAIWPQREMLNALIRTESGLITDATRPYLRDCYDHTIQLMDMIETDREIALGLVDIYLSSVSNRMNETMKVLTVFATIFMPLGFIASLYGMNFDTASPWNMPELGWRIGYPVVLAGMAAIAGGLVLYFRRKRWIGRDSAPRL